MPEPARTVPIPGSTGATSQDGEPHAFLGVALRESAVSKAVATIEIFDGSSESGTLLFAGDVPASGNASEWYGPDGIEVRSGEFFVKLSGTVKGTIFWR